MQITCHSVTSQEQQPAWATREQYPEQEKGGGSIVKGEGGEQGEGGDGGGFTAAVRGDMKDEHSVVAITIIKPRASQG